MTEITFTDRYQALGIPYPDPKTMCNGSCEGVGMYPVHVVSGREPDRAYAVEDNTPEEIAAWKSLHQRGHGVIAFFRMIWSTRDICFAFNEARRCDGWHFIECADCGGTGKLTQ